MTKRWKPKYGERYFAVAADAIVWSGIWSNCRNDRSYYKVGNCFRTRAKATAAAKKFKSLMLSLHEPTTNSSQSVTACDQLPKLTTEVFDRPDCPEWARYAAVDRDGMGRVFETEPQAEEDGWYCFGTEKQAGGGKYDASDWQNSLVERPSILPYWCKVDAVGWCDRYGYFKVTDIDDDAKGVYVQRVDDKSKGYFSFNNFCREVVHANSRPYNEAEMGSLVGKTITMPDGSVCLCTAYNKRAKAVIFDSIHWDAQELMDSGCTVDGKPCFVLLHIENWKCVE